MSNTIKISIIIPAYNTSQYVSKLVMSLRKQDLPTSEYEIIIVDDGSTDDTFLKFKENKLENMILIKQENHKQGSARNRGLKIATGEFIWFIDADDWIEPNVLATLYDRATQHDVEVLGFNCHHRQLPYLNKILPGTIFLNDKIPSAIKTGPCAAIYRRTWLLNHGLFFIEECIYEDNEYMPRIYYNASRILYVDMFIYNYHYNTKGSTKSKNVPKWVLDGFIDKVLPSMKQYADEIYEKDRTTGSSLYTYTCLTFNTFMRKMSTTDKQTFEELRPKLKEIIDLMLICSRRSIRIKYKVEGVILKYLPFTYKLYIKCK